jgi:hypothetical protein
MPGYSSKATLKARGIKEGYLASAAKLLGLSSFITRAAILPESLITADFLNEIALTDHGKHAIELLRGKYPRQDEAFYRLLILVEFWWEDLLVDPSATNINALIEGLSKFLASQELRICWLYGGLLYRQAFTRFPHEINEFSPDEARTLMEGTPQGVCQVRDLVAGPLGILRSTQLRYNPAYRTIPLWHCSDPSCDAIHSATVSVWPQAFTSARKQLYELLHDQYGNPSAWGALLADYDGDIAYYDHNALPGVPWLLGNTLSDKELTAVLRDLLGNNSKEIRQRLGPAGRGSPETIVANFDIAARLQAILLCSDQEIVQTIERLVTIGVISIPISEIRKPLVWAGSGGWFDLEIELSRMGVRTVSSTTPLQTARLKRLINEIYRLDGNRGQLD